MRDPLSTRVIGEYNVKASGAALALSLAVGYRPFIAAMPEAGAAAVSPMATYEPRVTVPANSFLWAISAKTTQPEGFTVQLTDMATKKPLFSEAIDFDNVSGQTAIGLKNCYGQAWTVKSQLHRLPVPLPILAPGLIAVRIQNLSSQANKVQLALHFSLPTRAAQQQPNEWNAELQRIISLAQRAIRDAGSSIYSSSIGGPSIAQGSGGGGAIGSSSDPEGDLIPVSYDVSALGDNIIIAGNAGSKIAVYQLDLWNVSQQTIQFFNGSTPLRGPLVDFPSTNGYGLNYSGKPHFVCDPAKPFIIRLSAGTEVTGFARYRME